MNDKDSERIEEFRQRLTYDPLTGILVWKNRIEGDRSTWRAVRGWNSNFAGKQAGTTDRHGYIAVNIRGKLNRAHRIGWALTYGYLPTKEIDHINGIRNDNRIENLRLASRSENNCNSKTRIDNTSGARGIYQHPNGKWRAIVTFKGKNHQVGYFPTLEDAKSARREAAKRIQGEFASNL